MTIKEENKNKIDALVNELADSKAKRSAAQTAKSVPVALQASKPKPILEKIGLEIIENIPYFERCPPNANITLYAAKILNSQLDVMRVARGVSARIEFQQDTDAFIAQEAGWEDTRSNYPDHVRLWTGNGLDIPSEQYGTLLIAGMYQNPQNAKPPFLAWSIHVRDGAVAPFRTLGFGRWTCNIAVSADLIEPLCFSCSFNVDSEGRLTNFAEMSLQLLG